MQKINFKNRREHFLSQLPEGSVAVIPAHPELIRNNDVHFKFRQESNFHYLTGFNEPDAIAVFKNTLGRREFVLFVRKKDLAKEIWTGFRAGVEGAVAHFGADRAYPLEEFDSQLLRLMVGCERFYYGFYRTLHTNGVETLDAKVLRLLNDYRASLGRTGRGLVPIHDVNEVLGEMRLFKTPEELERMRKAAQISAFAHCEAMARVRPGLNEGQIEAMIEFIFRDRGCERHGYPSIVAGGANSTILHYVDNNRELRDGELLLIDAGGEYEYYTADITRTFPINGKMSGPQRELYEIVLRVQKECIKMAMPGVTMASIHQFAVDALTDAMVSLKFLAGDRKALIDSQAFKKYYPHGTGHLLGMDVHDIGLYHLGGEPRKLEPGMAFTVEPGFYVLEQDTAVPEKYRGIGIRIEDDVVITPSGCEVLTSGVAKEVDEMAAIIGTKQYLTWN